MVQILGPMVITVTESNKTVRQEPPRYDSELSELAKVVRCYLNEESTLRDLADWLAGSFPWGEARISSAAQQWAGTFELLATEALEGLRPESDLRDEAKNFLSRKTGISVTSTTSNVTVAD